MLYAQNFEVLRGTSLTNRSINNDANILINQARQRSRACMLSSSSDTRQPVCATVGCRRSRRECSHCYYRYCLLCPETTNRAEIDDTTRARGRRERKATTAPLPHLFQGVEVLQRRFTTIADRDAATGARLSSAQRAWFGRIKLNVEPKFELCQGINSKHPANRAS